MNFALPNEAVQSVTRQTDCIVHEEELKYYWRFRIWCSLSVYNTNFVSQLFKVKILLHRKQFASRLHTSTS